MMKRMITLCLTLCAFTSVFAQTDSTGTGAPAKNDTIRIGGITIIRKAGSREIVHDREYKMRGRHRDKPSNLSTNWWIMDMGFSNFTDHSDYAKAASDGFVATGIGKDQLDLRSGKSRNINIWFFMQKLNVASHVFNLKYGLGLELNNYFFDNSKIVFAKNPTFISEGTTDFRKVKLAADYLTLPVMLNFDFTPRRNQGFGFSGGISFGYLYSARYKTKLKNDVNKVKNDFDLERFKISYVGELSLGPVRLYGSVAAKNMWSKSLDMTPYNFGFRFSNW